MPKADHDVRAVRGLLGIRARPVVLAVALGAGGALSALGLAALSAWLITRAWQMPPILYLSVAITAVRALGISRGVFRYLERLATHDLALRAMATARSRLFAALAAGPASHAVTLRRGDVLARTGSDIDDLGNALIRGVIPIGIAAVTNTAAVAIMALVSWPAAVVLAVTLAVSSVAVPVLAARGAARVLHDGAAARDALADAVTLALWHADELVVGGRRDTVRAAVSRAESDECDATDRGIRRQAAGAAATPLALAVSLVAACLIAIMVAGTPGTTPMTLGVLILLPLSAFEATAPLTEAGLQLERSRQSARRLAALLAATDSSAQTPRDVVVDDRPVTLDVTALDWGWPSAPMQRRQPLTMAIRPGQRIAVVGASGVGKSALLLTLAGLLPPLDGGVRARHADGDRTELEAVCCYFADDAHVFGAAVAENLRVARGDVTEAEMLAAVDKVGLTPWVRGLPQGLATPLTGGSAVISGGQRRRLLLARALIHRAPVVLLDEPTEHLDPDDSHRLLTELLSPSDLFGPERTVVVVTHQLPADLSGTAVIDLSRDGKYVAAVDGRA